MNNAIFDIFSKWLICTVNKVWPRYCIMVSSTPRHRCDRGLLIILPLLWESPVRSEVWWWSDGGNDGNIHCPRTPAFTQTRKYVEQGLKTLNVKNIYFNKRIWSWWSSLWFQFFVNLLSRGKDLNQIFIVFESKILLEIKLNYDHHFQYFQYLYLPSNISLIFRFTIIGT